MYDDRVAKLTTSQQCTIFAKNAQASHPELAKQARRRAVELRAAEYGAKTDAEREAIRAIYAFEDVRSKKTGRKARASRTWQSIKNNGIIPTVENVVSKARVTEAYDDLIEAGMDDFTFEAVVIRHPDAFTDKALQNAQARLAARTSKTDA